METINRREFLRKAGATVGIAALSGLSSSPLIGFAEEETVKFGCPFPFTGPYASEAEGQGHGAKLAAKEFNRRGGVLGKKVEIVLRDTELDNGVAVRRTKELIEDEGCKYICGCLSGGIARSMNKVCNEYGVVYVAPNVQDIAVGEDISKYGFSRGANEFMTVNATGRLAFEEFGKKWYSLSPDYRYGHRLYKSQRWLCKHLGGEWLGNTNVALGTEDFSPFLTEIRASGADVLFVNNFGADFIRTAKQLQEFGLMQIMKIMVSNSSTPMIWETGSAREGIYFGVEFDWSLRDQFETSKYVSDLWMENYDNPPKIYGARAFSGITQVLKGIQAVGDYNDVDGVVKFLEGLQFNGLARSPIYYEPRTHQCIMPYYIGEGIVGESKYDSLKIVGEVPGEKLLRPTIEDRIKDLPELG